MDEKNKRNIVLNAGIGLAIILLMIVLNISIRREQKESIVSQKSEVKKIEAISVYKPPSILSSTPSIRDKNIISNEEDITKQPPTPKTEKEESYQEVMLLKDLPVDSISPEEDSEVMENTIQPSPEDIKLMQKRGLLIY